MSAIRPAAVAGVFYPDDANLLAASVDSWLAACDDDPSDSPPVAIIVPHAGHVYSGPVAAHAYAGLRRWRTAINRVVVIGPNHRVPLHGLAVPSVSAFETPLGPVPIDVVATRALLRSRDVVVDDRPHADEHCIEVQLPFLQRVLTAPWSLVPVIAGDAAPGVVADALSTLWGEPGTLVVVSTDLSHHHSATTARHLDASTAERIVHRRWDAIDGDDACGAVPLCGALLLAERRGERVTLLDLRNSSDTAGPDDRVVGYGSFVVGPAA